jgi:homogentisate 1,2-dioxygenase
VTRDGFDGPFSILYHGRRPQAFALAETDVVWRRPIASASGPTLRRRHFPQNDSGLTGHAQSARVPLLFNADVVISRCAPDQDDAQYLSNADGDELLFIQSGGGRLISPFGHLPFGQGDYVLIPKAIWHRFELEGAARQNWLSLEFRSEVGPLSQFRNRAGQLRMDAPYSHRDFRVPEFRGPEECSVREVLVKRDDHLSAIHLEHSALDVVGYDGAVYPWAFHIRAFQPRVGSVHLPPTVHGTFQASGVLVCSFVPRLLDFGDGAIPCPYPHSSVDVDEVLFYSAGDFTSRSGVSAGSLTLHPRGVPHGPQPGRYEASLSAQRTDELAVMLDCALPLKVTDAAVAAEDPNYEQSFVGP